MLGRRRSKKWAFLTACALTVYIILSSLMVPRVSDGRDLTHHLDKKDQNTKTRIVRAGTTKRVQEEDKYANVKIPDLVFGEDVRESGTKGVKIERKDLTVEEQKAYDQGYSRHNFNEYVSDLISVDRQLPEARDPLCLNQTYPDDLPDTSVVICFLNEAFSVLVRSVHSIINTSPPRLLREIILVDDYSDYDNLNTPLDVYMRRFPKVRIVRNTEREGLIRSRLNGAAVATGSVLTFLDSHIECAEGWLEPLLARIHENPTYAVWPSIPFIDRHTFIFNVNPSARALNVGVFNWHMYFHWHHPRDEERETFIAPMKSPAMAGGLFAIDREFFFHIGSYDDQMRFWGGENIELSFRIWMCGGRLDLIPCSNVGHVYRERNVNANADNADAIRVNAARTAVVWLDQYKNLYAVATGNKLERYGDVSKRIELRKKLKCKSFDWYIENVYPSMFLPLRSSISGLVHNGHNSSLCLQAVNFKHFPVKTGICDKNDIQKQVFYVTDYEEIRLLSYCIDSGTDKPMMFPCHKMGGYQTTLYREDHTIYSPAYSKCWQLTEDQQSVELAACDGTPRQEWNWEAVPLDILQEHDVSL